jgi:hypothetical protein
VTPSSGFTILPGLDQTITVPANSVLYIATDGGAQTQSLAATGFSVVDVAIFVDLGHVAGAGYRRLIINNTPSLTGQFVNWSMGDTVTLTPGSHRISVAAAGVPGSPTPAFATVSGDSTSVLRGQLSITVLKK